MTAFLPVGLIKKTRMCCHLVTKISIEALNLWSVLMN